MGFDLRLALHPSFVTQHRVGVNVYAYLLLPKLATFRMSVRNNLYNLRVRCLEPSHEAMHRLTKLTSVQEVDEEIVMLCRQVLRGG